MRLSPDQSQEENTDFPQESWVFVLETPIFTGFSAILAVLTACSHANRAQHQPL
jgi:hypothetical protein